MSISYRKTLDLFKKRGITSYTFRKNRIIGQSAWKKLNDGGHIDTRTLDALCRFLDCQPGDLLEYLPDEPEPNQ